MTGKVSLEDMRRILKINEEPEQKPELKAEALIDDEGKLKIYNSTLKELSKEVIDYATDNLKPHFTEVIVKVNEDTSDKLHAEVTERLANLTNEVLALAETVRPIEIRTPKGNQRLKGVQHNQFQNLLTIVSTGQAVLLVGPAGTGKTHGAEKVAESLGLSFHSISVGSQTSKSDLQGYMTATGQYVRTQFREAYEHGGLFLLDEADAGNSNVLILLNAALSNGYMAFPDGMIKAHPNFHMVATANTYGNGASRQYVGRNQLDAATLDRFTVLNWDIDDKIEASLAGTDESGKRWLNVVRTVRKRVVEDLDLRVVISPRATLRGAQLLAAGMAFEDVMVSALTGSIPASSRSEVETLAKTTWNKSKS